ncbi:MAG: N-acetylmuramoyl-L-alanine amidase, partial [Armatimonadia bacterium]
MNTICLDAGHGYRVFGAAPSGARGNGLVEDDVVFGVVDGAAAGLTNRICHILRGHKKTVVMTRDKTWISIQKRCQVALAAKADVMVSVHCNAATNAAAKGYEIYVVRNDMRSKALALKVMESIHTAVGDRISCRGIKWDDQSQHSTLGVLRGTYRVMPAMLIEAGFL